MKDQVVIVTGAGRGIGAQIARTLHARGCRLALMSPSARSEAPADELGCLGLQGSVTDPDDLGELVTRASSHFGRIDGLVNNCGHGPGMDGGTGPAYDPAYRRVHGRRLGERHRHDVDECRAALPAGRTGDA